MTKPSSTRLIGLILGGLLILLIGWAVHWFFNHYERRYEQVQGEVSPMARRNPLLAAERFLHQLGMQAQSVSGRDFLTQPPQDSGVILINRFGRDLLPQQEQRLFDWVEQGGRLILVPDITDDQEDSSSSLMDRLGVERVFSPLDCDLDADQNESCDQETVLFEDSRYSEPIEVGFDPSWTLNDQEDRADWVLWGEGGAHLLFFRQGQGALILLSDNAMFHNDEIGHHDHALFLRLLMDDAQRIWLVYSSNMPSLLELLWRHLRPLVMASLVAAALWLWWLTGYSGPAIPPPPRARRNLLENLRASANHAWRLDRGKNMLHLSQQALEQLWQQRHPALGQMTPGQRSAWIAQHSGVRQELVETALYTQPRREGEFIRLSALQQKLFRAARGSHQARQRPVKQPPETA